IMDEMDLKIEEPSTVRCVMINEDKLASRGTTTIYIQFGDKEIPIKVEVIDSGKNEIVLGNGVLDMFKANIDYTDKTIIIRMNDETMDIPVKYTQRTIKGFEETFDEEEILEELYQDELKFILITDASGIGLGAVLAQKDDKGQEYVIEYASKSLNRTEQRWPITEQECYAIDIIENLEGITKELNRINYNYKFKAKNFEDSEERPLILETQEEILQIEVILIDGTGKTFIVNKLIKEFEKVGQS
ncbi:19509_t:CDS:2, partial [Rhizophagus irregularis]